MKKLHQKPAVFFEDRGRTEGLFAALIAVACVCVGLFSSPRLGTVNYGQYTSVMESAGLAFTQEDQQDADAIGMTRVLQEFDYKHFSYTKLFSPQEAQSILYPISLVRLLTQPFGLRFSTFYLALVYLAFIALSVYAVVRGGYCLLGDAALLPGAFIALCFTDGNLCAALTSFYPQGVTMVSFLLFCAMSLRGFTYASGRGCSAILPALAAGLFFVKSQGILALFLPVMLIIILLMFRREYPALTKKMFCCTLCGTILLAGALSSVKQFQNDANLHANAAVYHAAFNGLLTVSPDPVDDLKAVGLDESYLPDVGRSFYEAEEFYAHNPRDEDEAEALFSKLTTGRIFSFYLSHPQRMAEMLSSLPAKLNSFECPRNLAVGQLTTDEGHLTRSASWVSTLKEIVWRGNYGGFLASFLLMALCSFAFAAYRKKKDAALFVSIGLVLLSAILYLPIGLMFFGFDSFDLVKLPQVFFQDIGFAVFAGGACYAVPRLSRWYNRYKKEYPKDIPLPVRAPASAAYKTPAFALRLARFPSWAASSRRNTVLVCACFAVFMSSVLFFVPHAASVNNGDFGRMMDSLDIMWESDIYFNTSEQLANKAVETYAYRAPFQWQRLTFLEPSYSLVYPAGIVRLLTEPFGLPFNTYLLSIVMTLAAVLCVVSVVRDLYPVFGRFTLAFGIAMSAMFLCESYLVWFNSLFGEGCILLGMLMTVACAVHLSVLPRGKGRYFLFLLCFALCFLLCAKAQMLVALPVAAALILLFAWYHRPVRLDFTLLYFLITLIVCGAVAFSAVKVYQDNDEVSGKYTVWQSVFYGALMISDDPLADMEELGIDPAMAPDIGKDAYHPDSDYVYPPTSQEAEAAFYDHVNTFTVVKFYLKHPVKLYSMLNRAAEQSKELYNGFRIYAGQDYAEPHDTVDRFGLWLYWRSVFACGAFWQYVLLYGIIIAYNVCRIRSKKRTGAEKMLSAFLLGVMAIGVLQFPLSVVGNGFADNQKQLFGFALCHDLLVLFTGVELIRYAVSRRWKKEIPAVFKKGKGRFLKPAAKEAEDAG